MIYFDNAATSFPKPPTVCEEVDKCMRFYCGNPGRGTHKMSMAAAEKIYECREAVANLIGCESVENIVFTLNTTHALNMAIKGLLRHGDHVIISDLEHNSVYRPVYKMAENGIIQYDIFDSMTGSERRTPGKICSNIAKLIRPNTRLVICTHASNICSVTLPIKEIAALCHRHKILLVVDAAQSLGHLSVNMKDMDIDVLCAPGHKGLLGPAGCGIMAINNGVILETMMEGGNGIVSLDGNMPDFSPERYEVGTLATPAIAGLWAGVQAIKKTGVQNIHRHERMLYSLTLERLMNFKKVKIYAPEYRGATMLFNVANMPSDQLSRVLDEHGICVRSGFHCSPLAHKKLNTSKDGAVRISFGFYNTAQEIDLFYNALKSILK